MSFFSDLLCNICVNEPWVLVMSDECLNRLIWEWFQNNHLARHFLFGSIYCRSHTILSLNYILFYSMAPCSIAIAKYFGLGICQNICWKFSISFLFQGTDVRALKQFPGSLFQVQTIYLEIYFLNMTCLPEHVHVHLFAANNKGRVIHRFIFEKIKRIVVRLNLILPWMKAMKGMFCDIF